MANEIFYTKDGRGVLVMVSQYGEKRRYSYDAGITWRKTKTKARESAKN